MKYILIAAKDKLTTFGAPMIKYSDEVAKREFTKNCQESAYKDDLELYKLGTYDEENGKIELLEFPELMMKGDSINEI